MNYQHAIVVGASSGLGLEIVRLLVADGCKVVAVAPSFGGSVANTPVTATPESHDAARDRSSDTTETCGDSAVRIEHDVREFARIPEVFQNACKQLGGLDLVVYCAGVMPEVGPAEYCFAKDRPMLEVNLMGAVAWLNEAARRFDSTGRGTIVAIGSPAGDRGRRGQPVYNASKAGLATYMEALRNRLSRRGVKVVTIKPGPLRTPMTAHLHLRSAMEPDAAAKLVLKKSRRTGEHYLKLSHRVIFAVIRLMPSFVFRRLKV